MYYPHQNLLSLSFTASHLQYHSPLSRKIKAFLFLYQCVVKTSQLLTVALFSNGFNQLSSIRSKEWAFIATKKHSNMYFQQIWFHISKTVRDLATISFTFKIPVINPFLARQRLPYKKHFLCVEQEQKKRKTILTVQQPPSIKVEDRITVRGCFNPQSNLRRVDGVVLGWSVYETLESGV